MTSTQPAPPTLLKQLVRDRHWGYEDFREHFHRTAADLGFSLEISRRQFDRWLAADMVTTPYPRACQVLETMFGHPVARLLAPPDSQGPAGHQSGPVPRLRPPDNDTAGAGDIGDDEFEEHDLPWTHGGAVTALEVVSRTSQPHPTRRTFLLVTGAAALVPAGAWLRKDPDPSTAGFGARRVGDAAMTHLRARLDQLRRLDDDHGTIALLPAITGDLAYVVTLLKDASYTEAIGRRLQACAAELARLTGWGHYEAGRDDTAQRALQAALRAAHTSGDRLLGAHILSVLAMQAYNAGDPRDAVAFVETAQAGIRSAPPVVSALLTSRLARAHAEAHAAGATGHARPARTEIERAKDLIAEESRGDDPDWAYYITPAAIAAQAGSTYLALGEYDLADREFQTAIGSYQGEFPRDQAVTLSRLARTYLGRHELRQACDTGTQAVRLLAEHVDSPRTIDFVRGFADQLAPHSGTTPVRDFTEEARVLLTKVG